MGYIMYDADEWLNDFRAFQGRVKIMTNKERLKAQVEAESNEELLENTLDACSPDDYDGMFTEYGHWERDYRVAILTERLKKFGFLIGVSEAEQEALDSVRRDFELERAS